MVGKAGHDQKKLKNFDELQRCLIFSSVVSVSGPRYSTTAQLLLCGRLFLGLLLTTE
jgi:hypothetical protein